MVVVETRHCLVSTIAGFVYVFVVIFEFFWLRIFGNKFFK
jgi:hypothetical protein